MIELEDEELIFSNYGKFIPGSVEKVVIEDAPEEQYRNPFLATAMFNLKMVDTAGGGIKKMFNFQRQRLFPMPDYDLSDNKVKVTIIGKVLDLDFARILARNADLSLEEIMALDKVQKKKDLSDEEARHLKECDLIEGRKPNYYLSIKVAAATGNGDLKAQYIKNRGFDDDHYRSLIVTYLEAYSSASRRDIDNLLIDKLPGALGPIQKRNKIQNLLASLRTRGTIKNLGSAKKPSWILVERRSKQVTDQEK